MKYSSMVEPTGLQNVWLQETDIQFYLALYHINLVSYLPCFRSVKHIPPMFLIIAGWAEHRSIGAVRAVKQCLFLT